MSNDIFLKITGIAGESQDAAHKNEIEVSSWGWQVSQQSAMHSGSGGGAGKASADELAFLHSIDRASPNLMKYCLTGKHIPEAALVIRKAGGNPLEYLKITMNDVIVTAVQPVCDAADSYELVHLSFAKIKQEYTVQNAQGGSAGAVTAGFDIKGNRET